MLVFRAALLRYANVQSVLQCTETEMVKPARCKRKTLVGLAVVYT